MSVLKGTKGFYDYGVSDVLGANLQQWLEYGLLEMGAYTNVKPSGKGWFLQKTQNDVYPNRVYEGLGPGWVWETDVVPVTGDDPPIRASGVTIGSTFYPTVSTSGQYAHKIDFRHGRVIFDNPVTAQVKCEYSFRDVAVYLTDSPERKILDKKFNEYAMYQDSGTLSPSGMAQTLKENRVHLPAVFIDITNVSSAGLQIGGGDINNFEVAYHIFSDNAKANRRLSDILTDQYQHSLNLFDANNIQFPYNYDGTLHPSALTYPNLANRDGQYFWTYARINDVDGGAKQASTDVYRAEVSHSIEVDRYLKTI